MSEFTKITATAVPVNINNIDTDQILPARYLLLTTKDGYADLLFRDWRFNEDGSEKKDFIINKPEYEGAEILITGSSFGAGSSREHAVWAINQYGFKVVIAPSFSDIFKNNAYGNGLLVFTLDEKIVQDLMRKVSENPKYKITVDLPNQKITTEENNEYNFEINPFIKNKLIKGLDNIGYILDKEEKIKEYEVKYNK